MGRPRGFDREKVLEQAIPVFWKKGFADTSVQELEEATGVNKSGLYSEFSGKDDLFVQSVAHYVKKSPIAQILSKEPLGLKNLEEFFCYRSPSSSDLQGCFLINCYREVSIIPKAAKQLLCQSQGQLREGVIANLKAARARLPERWAEILLAYHSGLRLSDNLGRPSEGKEAIRELLSRIPLKTGSGRKGGSHL